jgi:primosomal protein N'
MTVFVEVAVNIPRVSGVFHYHLPAVLEDQIEPGQLVEVPFGEQQVQGVLLKVIDEPEVAETKAVTTILDREITLTPHQIKLAYSISHTTLTPLSQCISLMLPTGISQLADRLYSFVEDAPPSDDLSPTANQLLAVLRERGSLRGRW